MANWPGAWANYPDADNGFKDPYPPDVLGPNQKWVTETKHYTDMLGGEGEVIVSKHKELIYPHHGPEWESPEYKAYITQKFKEGQSAKTQKISPTFNEYDMVEYKPLISLIEKRSASGVVEVCSKSSPMSSNEVGTHWVHPESSISVTYDASYKIYRVHMTCKHCMTVTTTLLNTA